MDKNTLFITSQSDDPAFNLAAEEMFLREKVQNIMFFYINRPSVIVGKHQNALSEINQEYLEKNKIPVYRRLSGGGTVFHDKGNINYCIIENNEAGHLVDFVRATTPVVEALNKFGVEARHGKRNDLLAGYKKISGNACHVYKSRSMHHGTLLYQSNLKNLTEALKVDDLKFKDKSVKSVRSEVANISELTNSSKSPEEFMQYIANNLVKKFKATHYTFSETDLQDIEILKIQKYNTWLWNYGYSPSYGFTKRSHSDDYIFSSKLKVEKGIITEISIKTTYPDKKELQKAVKKIERSIHEKEHLKNKLAGFRKEIIEGIVSCLF